MADKNKKNSGTDDIDEFFAKFDEVNKSSSSNSKSGPSGKGNSQAQPSRPARPANGSRASGNARPTGTSRTSGNVRPASGQRNASNARSSGGQRSAANARPASGQRNIASARPASGQQNATNQTHRTGGSQTASNAYPTGGSHSAGNARAANNAPVQNPNISGAATSNPSQSKRGKKRKPHKKGKHRKLKIFLLIVLVLILIGIVYVATLIMTADTHNIDADNIYQRLQQRSTIYDDEGKEIENVFLENGNRTNVEYNDLPQDLINAIVAIEDKTFWEHHGFNFVRIMGAIKDSVVGGGQISGTSTLTQQLARNIYLSDQKSERTINRKILEAYYAVLIEQNLTKEQIVEAYLNTVYLGFNCYGVETASQEYFGKGVEDLDLLECVSLASLPKSPDSYALVKTLPAGTTGIQKKDILAQNDAYVYTYNGKLSADRREQTLSNMVEEGYITQSAADKALRKNLKKKMKISVDQGSGFSSYFTDFALDQITEDIMEEYGLDETRARNIIYTGGLKIYTTMNKRAQKIVEKEFADSSNLPGVSSLRKDIDGNILNNDTGDIMLYDYDDYFNDKDEFVLSKKEFKRNSDGSLTLYRGKRLSFYEVETNGKEDISIDFKAMYQQKDGKFYSIEGGALSIPQGYKDKDAKGNCIISAKFFEDYPTFFKKRSGKLVVSSKNYTLQQKVVQPQCAMVIMDYKTGGIKAMVGGRGTSGKKLHNRATNPRQPGSTMKPISIYSSALQSSFNAAKQGESMNLSNSDGSSWGSYITAGSVINDAPMTYNGKVWPKNFYSGNRGRMTLRTAVQQSVNVCAVKTYKQIDPEFAVSQLKKMGITTIVEDGSVNDMNPAALALGGMTKGISPLEMTAAYGTFPNSGTYTEPVAYTKITNSDDEVIFDKVADTEDVLDEGVAFIMTDILRSTVTQGIATNAAFSGQPVAGKTGTTNENYDIWFSGFTPQYSAALWIGNDVNIELSSGSSHAAAFWSNIMSQVCEGLSYGEYPKQPKDVTRINGEYYTEGTYSKVSAPSYYSNYSSGTQQQTQLPTRSTYSNRSTETTRKVVVPTTRKKSSKSSTTQATKPPATVVPTTQPQTQNNSSDNAGQ